MLYPVNKILQKTLVHEENYMFPFHSVVPVEPGTSLLQ